MSDAIHATKIEQEIARYKHVENVHDLPAIFHYWSNGHLLPKLKALGLEGIDPFYLAYARRAAPAGGGELRILSVGAGNCDTEIRIATLLVQGGLDRFRFDCLDVNPHMLARGREAAAAAGHRERFHFIETDVNRWTITDRYHLVMANQSLHHFVDLEVLFDKIAAALLPDGFFVTNDMIGRNGHMRWPEALEHVQQLWTLLDDRHKYNQQLQRFEAVYENWDCSKDGFEGIRAQDILPLLIRRFRFDLFLAFANLTDIFTDRGFGHNFDAEDKQDRAFIDYVAFLDDYLIEHHLISPTHMIAAMTLSPVAKPRFYKHLTPEFCVREPATTDTDLHAHLAKWIGRARGAGVLRFVPGGVKRRLKVLLKM